MTGYKKNRSWILKNTDVIKLLLDDQQANLQTVASSRYVAAFVKQIRHWE
jgi:dynein heavy chain